MSFLAQKEKYRYGKRDLFQKCDKKEQRVASFGVSPLPLPSFLFSVTMVQKRSKWALQLYSTVEEEERVFLLKETFLTTSLPFSARPHRRRSLHYIVGQSLGGLRLIAHLIACSNKKKARAKGFVYDAFDIEFCL